MDNNQDPFAIAGDNHIKAIDVTGQFPQEDTNARIQEIIKSAPVVLFMKGNGVMPQCGFSANSVAIVSHCCSQFHTYNILMDQELREGLKQYSNWPTYPQLYINGEFVGGNDILTEMYHSGEIQEMLKPFKI